MTHKPLTLGQTTLTSGQLLIVQAAVCEGLPVRVCTCGLVIVGDSDGVAQPWARHLTFVRRYGGSHPSGGAL